MNNKRTIWLPLLLSLFLAVGMFIGYKMHGASPATVVYKARGGLLEQVTKLVENRYVDSIDFPAVQSAGIEAMLQQLDPYSTYIPAVDFEEVNQPLEGNFEGIGIEFYRLSDTIMVVSAISGGPSEAVGLRAGDKIVTVDGINVTGPEITNDDVIKKLRGNKGTKVKVEIARKGQPRLLPFTITRGKIPIYSVDVAYRPLPGTGYIKINKFSATTAQEFRTAFAKLAKIAPLQHLILDLRGNPGGYLDAAIALCDEFLPDRELITYTAGRTQPRRDYPATKNGLFEKGKIYVLIDEGSASASEIVAGAVQDQDRGTIIGRRSFGKGLVQEQFGLSDGSAIRLTVARYYTPSGRSIQKPYDRAKSEDLIDRFTHGEVFSADSIQINDSLAYTTKKGRTVYGGGGIIPDVFVAADSSQAGPLLTALFNSGLLVDYSYTLADQERALVAELGTAVKYVQNYQVTDQQLKNLLKLAEAEKISVTPAMLKAEQVQIKLYLKAYMGRQLFGNDAFYPVLHQEDATLLETLTLIKKAIEG